MPGFISFPSANFNSDPATATTPTSDNRYVQQTVATPVLRGSGGLTFDWTAGRWIPAAPQNISLDHRRYAYVDIVPDSSEPLRNRTPVHLVDLATGSDRVVHDGGSLAVLDFAQDGIFLTEATYGFSEGVIKVFLLDPDTGAFATVLGTNRPFVQGAGGGAAWTVDDAPGTSPSTQYRLIGDRLSRVDINGQITPWFQKPSMDVFLIGFDLEWHPIVAASNATSLEVWVAYSPSSATRLYAGPADYIQYGSSSSGAIPDEPHGIWFSTTRGVYLYTAAQGVKLVATGLSGFLSGTCG